MINVENVQVVIESLKALISGLEHETDIYNLMSYIKELEKELGM